MSTPSKSDAGLGLSQQQLDAFLDLIDQRSQGACAPQRRQFNRWRYRVPSVHVAFTKPGSTKAVISAATRDISCQGISLIHGSFMHPNSRLSFSLPSLVDNDVFASVDGSVVRCVQLRKHVFEIGVRFDKPIDARMLVQADRLDEHYSFEIIDPRQLNGIVVYAEDSEMDQRLVRQHLSETHLNVFCNDTTTGAFDLVKQGCDLVMCDFHLTNGNGFELVRMIRNRMLNVPIVMLSGDPLIETREQVFQLHINGFLRKPIEKHSLLRTIGEFVLLKSIVEDIRDTDQFLSMEQSMHNAYLIELSMCIPKLHEVMRSPNAAIAEDLCRQISGAAPCVGLAPIGSVAAQAADRLKLTASVEQSADLLTQLVTLCAQLNL